MSLLEAQEITPSHRNGRTSEPILQPQDRPARPRKHQTDGNVALTHTFFRSVLTLLYHAVTVNQRSKRRHNAQAGRNIACDSHFGRVGDIIKWIGGLHMGNPGGRLPNATPKRNNPRRPGGYQGNVENRCFIY